MQSFPKQPHDVLDYDIDMSNWFADIPQDDINDVVITVDNDDDDESPIIIGPPGHSPFTIMGNPAWRIKIWIAGGSDQTDYVVTVVVGTEQDRKKEVEFKLKVRDL